MQTHAIEFTGRGSEYFRVWIVNLLLTLVTVGLYTPWARRRTFQYFYSHTYVAGSPLEFTGKLRKMVTGFLLMAALYLAYNVAAETGQHLVSGLLLLGFVALSPFLWGSAMRFRLGATRWRGVRLAFTARWREVYIAAWPMFAIAAIWALFIWWVSPAFSGMEEWLESEDTALPASMNLQAMHGLGFLLAIALSALAFVRLHYNFCRLRVLRARAGNQPGHWRPKFGDFVRVWLASLGVFLLSLLLVGALLAALIGTSLYTSSLSRSDLSNPLFIAFMVIFFLIILGVFMVFISLPARAYREARTFQLVWNNVGISNIVRFKTNLRTWPFVRLRMKNLLLIFLTLGFYRPFAINSEYAAKLGSITLYVKGGIDQLEGELVRAQGAFGDAVGDLMGFDLIG